VFKRKLYKKKKLIREIKDLKKKEINAPSSSSSSNQERLVQVQNEFFIDLQEQSEGIELYLDRFQERTTYEFAVVANQFQLQSQALETTQETVQQVEENGTTLQKRVDSQEFLTMSLVDEQRKDFQVHLESSEKRATNQDFLDLRSLLQ
jgi:hypothetical protein